MPHGACLFWEPGLVWLHVLSDIGMGAAYYCIAGFMAYFMIKKREAVPFPLIFGLFIIFIFACGTTHLFAAYTIYKPAYWQEGIVKAVTAVISIYAALLLIPKWPEIIGLPSLPRALEEVRSLNEKMSLRMGELKESRDKYSALIETTNTGFVILDQQGKVLDANAEYVRLAGYQRLDEIRGRSVTEWTAEYEKDRNAEEVKRCFERGCVRNLEIDYVDKHGKVIPVEINATVVTINGEPQIFTLCNDITDRRAVEGTLRVSEEKYRNLFNNSEVAMFRTRFDGSEVLDVNQKFLDIVGRTREETLGRPSAILWADPAERQAMVRRLAADGRVAELEFKMLNKHGEVRHCITSLVLYPEQGILEGSILDITDRVEASDSLKKSLKEKEILLSEIHHRVKNNMAIISSFLSLQSKHIKDESVRQVFLESRQRIKSMALVHEKLYRSGDLKNIDIGAYIAELSNDLLQAYHIGPIAVRINADPFRMGLDMLIPFGLILNEIITNALKHAFSGITEPAIDITLRQEGGDTAVLIVSDNGVGLPADEEILKKNTLGMDVIKSLTSQLEGMLEIDRSSGTKITLRFPLKDERR